MAITFTNTKFSQDICGLDEAGRGAFAGPLVAAAVWVPVPFEHISKKIPFLIRDSKVLSSLQREYIFQVLNELCIPMYTATILTEIINKKGIGWSNVEIFKMLIKQLEYPKYIIDGNLNLRYKNKKNANIRSLVDADATIFQVMLAGIVAKVTRDKIMHGLSSIHPQYYWHRNKGYGTQQHIKAILTHGVTKYHRRKFVDTALRNFSHSRNNIEHVTTQFSISL